jgi:hypothetical protein
MGSEQMWSMRAQRGSLSQPPEGEQWNREHGEVARKGLAVVEHESLNLAVTEFDVA